MDSRPRAFVYEYLSGGGAAAAGEADAALLAAGTAMRDALAGDLALVRDVTVTCATRRGERLAPTAGIVAVAPRADETAASFVSRQAELHDAVFVIAPETDGILASLHDTVPPSRWMGSGRDAIAVASSKRATSERLRAHGIATPERWGDPGVDSSVVDGWVVKPDDGAGALDTARYAHRAGAQAEWVARTLRGASAVMQPWLSGEPMSVSLLCRKGMVEVLSINRQHIATDDAGKVSYRGVSIAAVALGDARARDIVRTAERTVAALPGLKGFVGIDLVDVPGVGPVVVEVNPRLTCAYVGLSRRLGHNVAQSMLEDAAPGSAR